MKHFLLISAAIIGLSGADRSQQMAQAAPDSPATAYSPDTDVILIERNHLCDRKMLSR